MVIVTDVWSAMEYGTNTLTWLAEIAVMGASLPPKKTFVLPRSVLIRLFSVTNVNKKGGPISAPNIEMSSPGAIPELVRLAAFTIPEAKNLGAIGPAGRGPKHRIRRFRRSFTYTRPSGPTAT